MKKNFLLLLWCFKILPIIAAHAFNDVDLELTMNTPDLTPNIYTSNTANIVLTNTGNQTATNITITIPVPYGFVLTGSNPFNLTAGNYSSYFGLWTLENLAPGASQTLTLNLYSLTENEVNLYGEVASVDQSDVDSSPGNGIAPTPIEDDEAVLNFNRIGGPGLPDLIVNQVVVPNSIPIGVLTTIEYEFSNIGYAIAEGPFTVYFYYSRDDELNFGDQQVGQKTHANIPAGTMLGEASNIMLLANQGIAPGEGYLILKIDNDNTVAESNENNNVIVSSPFSVISIPNNGNIDLEISLNQTNISPNQFSAYSVQLSVDNTGLQVATNVKVSIPKPDGIVYIGGNPFSLNIGTFSTYTDIYSIPSIAPGATAYLTLNYFLLEAEAPNVYAQVTQANQTDTDSTPNNGTPPIPNEDDEASTQTTNPPGNLPDLIATNIDIPMIIYKGVPTAIAYRLENQGTTSVTTSFDVFYYYSSDDQLSDDDQAFGQSSFENLSVGGFADELFTFTFLEFFSNSIPLGPGYIIIKVDHENSVLESNEDNNIMASAVNISTINSTPECATDLGVGRLNCIQDTQDGGKELYFTRQDTDGTVTGFIRTIEMDGNLGNGEELEELAPEITYEIANINRLQKLENGMLVEEMTIPASITDNYEFVTGATAFNTGFIVFAVTSSDLTAILTDENLNPIEANLLTPLSPFISAPAVEKVIQISPDQVAIVVIEDAGLPGRLVGLMVINSNLEVLSGEILATSQFVIGNLTKTICGDYYLSTSTFSLLCGGQCNTTSTALGNFVNGQFMEQSGSDRLSRTTMGPNGSSSTSSFSNRLQTADGGLIQASGGSASNQVLIEKTLNGNIVSSKTIELTGRLLNLMEISGQIYLVVNGIDQILRYYDLDCLDEVTTPVDGVDLELTSELSVDGPEIYSNYSVVYTLTNNGNEDASGIEVEFVLPAGTVYQGSNPFSISRGNMSSYNNLYTLNELSAGETVVIELNYFSLTNAPIHHYGEVIATNEEDIDSTPNNGTPPTVNEDDETAISTAEGATTNSSTISSSNDNSNRLKILKLYPNPVMEEDIRIVLNAPEANENTLVLFNELGVEVFRRSYSLDFGFNEIVLPTKDLTAGRYRVMLSGHPTKFGSANFMVIR